MRKQVVIGNKKYFATDGVVTVERDDILNVPIQDMPPNLTISYRRSLDFGLNVIGLRTLPGSFSEIILRYRQFDIRDDSSRGEYLRYQTVIDLAEKRQVTTGDVSILQRERYYFYDEIVFAMRCLSGTLIGAEAEATNIFQDMLLPLIQVEDITESIIRVK